jgi:RNA polymerase sigma-70 factor (ECF subfamily)
MDSNESGRPEPDVVGPISLPGCVTTTGEHRQIDDAFLRSVYERYGAALFEFVLRKTSGDRQWAEEVVQETMLRVWRNAGQIDFVAELRPLLYTIARRLVIDGRRRRGARPPEVGSTELDEVPAADQLDRSLMALTVKQAMRSLTAAHRTVIIELYVRGRTIEDVADELGVPRGTVKSRAYYGLRALREALERLGVDGMS